MAAQQSTRETVTVVLEDGIPYLGDSETRPKEVEIFDPDFNELLDIPKAEGMDDVMPKFQMEIPKLKEVFEMQERKKTHDFGFEKYAVEKMFTISVPTEPGTAEAKEEARAMGAVVGSGGAILAPPAGAATAEEGANGQAAPAGSGTPQGGGCLSCFGGTKAG